MAGLLATLWQIPQKCFAAVYQWPTNQLFARRLSIAFCLQLLKLFPDVLDNLSNNDLGHWGTFGNCQSVLENL
jgi:hypothetical protein